MHVCLSIFKIAPLSMHCFYGGGEIAFPSTFTVQRIENRVSSHKISSVPILQLSSSLFESALSPFELDRHALPNETYLQFKEEKQNVLTLSILHSP